MGKKKVEEGSFAPLLAESVDDIETVKYPVYAAPKYDGIRGIYFRGRLVARSLDPIQNNHVRFEVEEALVPVIPGYVLDGELVSGKNIQDTTSAINTATGHPEFTYNLFDLIGGPVTPESGYAERLLALESLVKLHQFPDFIKVIPHTLIHDAEELRAFVKDCLNAGAEGVVLRAPNGRYKYGRSTVTEGLLLRIVEKKTFEAQIDGVYEQMENTNVAEKDNLGHTKRSSAKAGKVGKDTLGGFYCHTFDGTHFKVATGKGLTKSVRKRLWLQSNRGADLIGKFIKLEAKDYGEKDKPRQPIFVCFRDPSDFEK